MPRLFSYVVARDYGFAPNPFYGFCTLATCKPKIRKAACPGDWVIGTGSKSKGLERRIVYAMRMSEAMSFNEYWNSLRFRRKRPDMYASIKRAFGDNIYHQDHTGKWRQADSHHSHQYGSPNNANIQRDISVDRVLISDDFAYWGGSGPEFPLFSGHDIHKNGQGHKCSFPSEVVDAFIEWLHSLNETGYCDDPHDWNRL